MPARSPIHESVNVPPVAAEGELHVPAGGRGLVLFAHGSGSSHRSPRNTYVAEALRSAGLGTLLFDLLTPEEAADRRNVFDIPLLGERLLAADSWCRQRDDLAGIAIGYFGASTGAAAALVAAARCEAPVGAVVSRGGRPDLAGEALGAVEAPTLLIVGGLDTQVLELNREAAARMHCEQELRVVAGATHLFEEPGTLDEVIDLAREWFAQHLLGAQDEAESG